MSVYNKCCGNCSHCHIITTCEAGYCENKPDENINLFFTWCEHWEPLNLHIMEYRKFGWLKIIEGMYNEVKNRA